MLEATYIHIPGIGYRTERAIHRDGLITWNRFLQNPPRLNPRQRARILAHLPDSLNALREGRVHFFARNLPPGEHWRLLPAFKDRAVCLDIETCSPYPDPGSLTVVGLYDFREYQVLVAGIDMEALPEMLMRYDVIVTYNGKRFDIPFLEACGIRGLRDKVHIDLMYLCHRLGIKGGLKAAERKVGIERPKEVAGLDGYDAVLLWQAHLRGEQEALPRLIAYNRCDTVNLARLFEALLPHLLELIRGGKRCG